MDLQPSDKRCLVRGTRVGGGAGIARVTGRRGATAGCGSRARQVGRPSRRRPDATRREACAVEAACPAGRPGRPEEPGHPEAGCRGGRAIPRADSLSRFAA